MRSLPAALERPDGSATCTIHGVVARVEAQAAANGRATSDSNDPSTDTMTGPLKSLTSTDGPHRTTGASLRRSTSSVMLPTTAADRPLPCDDITIVVSGRRPPA